MGSSDAPMRLRYSASASQRFLRVWYRIFEASRIRTISLSTHEWSLVTTFECFTRFPTYLECTSPARRLRHIFIAVECRDCFDVCLTRTREATMHIARGDLAIK